jgi:molybdopterin/thiamine biosynthesis adenylyltransferase
VERKQKIQNSIRVKCSAKSVMTRRETDITDAVAHAGEFERYKRQLRLLGEAGQRKLKNASVTIAGAGGLGSASAAYLTVAGVGRIQVVDNDTVELSNLNRQIIHWDEDIRRSKAESFEEKLSQMNPEIEVVAISKKIKENNVADVLHNSDVIVDALDNFQTRYILNRAALQKQVPLIHGGVYGFEGQVTTIIPGKTACLRCIFPEAPFTETFSVIGTTCGVIGCIQATEVIKYIVGLGDLLTNRLWLWDGLDARMEEFKVNRNPVCEDCGEP